MNPKQIDLIRRTCREVAPIADSAAEVFYQKLFQLSPALRPVFAAHLSERGRRLMETVEAAAGALDKPEAFAAKLPGLATRQIAAAAGEHRVETIGAALIVAFRQGLGPSFTPEARQAWIALFDHIDELMKSGDAGCGVDAREATFATAA